MDIYFLAHAYIHTHTHRVIYIRAMQLWRKGFWKEKGFQGRLKRTDRGRMTNRNWELVPDSWSPVWERVLITGLCSEGWYSEHSGVCRRAELLGRSVYQSLQLATQPVIKGGNSLWPSLCLGVEWTVLIDTENLCPHSLTRCNDNDNKMYVCVHTPPPDVQC